ncbi:Protein-associating with the carboxyl-terminal domain of ezrin [Geranomyces variabilis]|nr:Protein-associating with the carboxyl-terminal domain of ezrin [Geranomyces variabilis]
MGASESKLFSGYNVQTTWAPAHTAFTVHRAISKAAGSPVTVFSYKPPPGAPAEDASIVSRAVQRLRTIRHPGILKFVTQAGDKAFVTESVTPLSEMLASFGPEDVIFGLFNIIKTLVFLHSEELSHNNLQLSSIYVTENGNTWVVGGMEYATGFDDYSISEMLPKLHQHYPPDAIPPEDTPEGKQGQVPGIQPDSRDSYALGKLITAVIKPMLAPDTLKDARASDFRWQELQQFADRLMSPAWEDRPRVVDALRHPWFTENVLINVVELFLKNIRVVHPDVKRMRFQELPDELRSLSVTTLTSHVLPLVLTESFASEPGVELFFEQLFVPRVDDSVRGILPPSSYCELVLPFVESMLRVRTYNVRLLMLSLFHCYLAELLHWDDTLLQRLIVPELVLGLEDKDDNIYLLSLCALTEATGQLCSNVPQVHTGSAPWEGSSEESPQRPALGAKSPSQDGRLGAGLVQAVPGGDIPKAVRKKPVSSPTQAKPGERPPVKRNVSVGLLAGGSETNVENSTVASVRVKRHNSGLAALPPTGDAPPPATATSAGNEGPDLQHTPHLLVEEHIIPHTLSVCVQESVTTEQQWAVLDSVVVLWKKLCVAEVTNKGPTDVRYITTSLVNCFHLILRVLPPDMKKEFYCGKLVGDAAGPLESSAIHWLARTIDLGTPFIKDENRDVRREITQAVLNVISVVSAAMDRAPTITRKRQGEKDVAGRLRKVYGRLARTKTVFPRTGPRPTNAGEAAALPVRTLSRDSGWQEPSLSAKSSQQDLTAAPPSTAATQPDADSWGDEHWGEDENDDKADQKFPQPAAAPESAPGETTTSTDSLVVVAPHEPVSQTSADVPDPRLTEEEEQAREAERLARLEKLKAKREAREAELRRKRDLKRASIGHVVATQSLSSADGLEGQNSAASDSVASATPRTSETNAQGEQLPPLAPPVTVLDIVGRDAAESIAALPKAVTSPQGVEKVEVEEEDFFEDMQPTLPPPTLLVLDRLVELAANASPPPDPLSLNTNPGFLPQQSELVQATPPPLTPASSRLAVVDALQDGAEWGEWGLES